MTPHSTYLPPHLAALFAHARTDFRPLRSIAAQEIERLIDFLDALDGDTDLEADQYRHELDAEGRHCLRGASSDDEPSLCGLAVSWPGQPGTLLGCGDDPDDLEDDRADFEPDDTGIADAGGLSEQVARHSRHLARLDAIASAESTDRRAPRLRLTVGGVA